MVNRDGLRKRAASQSTMSQVTKRNSLTGASLNLGLHTVLARCPLQPLSSGEEEDEDENGDEEVEEDREAQESEEDLDQGEDVEDENNAGLINPDVHQPPQELPDEQEVGFKTASGRIVRLSRGATEALEAIKVVQVARATKASKLTLRTQKPTKRSTQKSPNLKSTSKRKLIKSVKISKASKTLSRREDVPEKAIAINSSSPTPPEPEVVIQYYTAIWKARVGEEDLASTSAQRIVGGELLNSINSWIDEVKVNIAGKSFEDKYSIKAIASYDRITARDMVPQDIHSNRHIYNLYEILRTWHAEGRKGLRVEVVVTLTEKPVPETALTQDSPYALSAETLQRALPANTLLSSILEAGATSSYLRRKVD